MVHYMVYLYATGALLIISTCFYHLLSIQVKNYQSRVTAAPEGIIPTHKKTISQGQILLVQTLICIRLIPIQLSHTLHNIATHCGRCNPGVALSPEGVGGTRRNRNFAMGHRIYPNKHKKNNINGNTNDIKIFHPRHPLDSIKFTAHGHMAIAHCRSLRELDAPSA